MNEILTNQTFQNRTHLRADGAAQCMARPTALALALRSTIVLATAGCYLTLAGVSAAALWCVSGRHAAQQHLALRTTALLQRLGPTFIKGGQILSTRRDELPSMVCDALALLQDGVAPLRKRTAKAALEAALGPAVRHTFSEINDTPIASGSVASVYFARLQDGAEVAVKLQRPGIATVIARDLALIRLVGALVARMPFFCDVPVTAVIEHLCITIATQLDFKRESACLERLSENLSAVPRVWVPRPYPALARDTVVVMQFVPGLSKDTLANLSVAVRRRIAATALSAVYQMLFVDGFVHCDLHPGNLYLKPSGQVVILDAGFSIQLSERMRRLFAEFFLEMALGRSPRCAEIVVASAVGRRDDAEIPAFVEAMARLVERSHGLPAKDFSLIAFAREMFDLHQRHGLRAAPELIFPLLSLLVIEGTVRALDPDIDFQETAKPILTRAAFGNVISVHGESGLREKRQHCGVRFR